GRVVPQFHRHPGVREFVRSGEHPEHQDIYQSAFHIFDVGRLSTCAPIGNRRQLPRRIVSLSKTDLTPGYEVSWKFATMKISAIETIHLSRGITVYAEAIQWLWVRIHTDEGLVGLVETYPHPEA